MRNEEASILNTMRPWKLLYQAEALRLVCLQKLRLVRGIDSDYCCKLGSCRKLVFAIRSSRLPFPDENFLLNFAYLISTFTLLLFEEKFAQYIVLFLKNVQDRHQIFVSSQEKERKIMQHFMQFKQNLFLYFLYGKILFQWQKWNFI